MESIFHEKQEGSLCAQHCLNALLQGPYFTPVDLGSLAQRMDDLERIRMAENGIDSEEYQRFLAQPSENMDDSGYFSVQVISSALEVWGLELVPYTSTERRAREAFSCPHAVRGAYICHYRDHWFTVRRLGKQWFNLNSLLNAPELISDTYLAMFLTQLQQEGYSIFVVFGQLPDCDADRILNVQPIARTKLKQETVSIQEDDGLQLALLKSLEGESNEGLEEAVALSLQCSGPQSDEDSELEKAIKLSLSCQTPPTADEVRQRRMAFLNQLSKTGSAAEQES